ncbi:MarR family winged helix-turn-helix transcriptional regulator [Pseudobdellovibrio sp. HCB154]|uniref:MarR family winged helix-turn-helix transcriptional regulator n=1 Tax=Pseudobdellovibrio sp. HCB154 TaxID=3386277 RepID=UPI003916EDFC
MAKKTIQQNTICSNADLLRGELFKNVCKKNHFIDETRIEMLVSLMALTKELEAGKAENLKRYKMSEGRFFVLMALWQADRPLKATEIAEGLGVSRATMTGLLDSLVEDELVIKTDSEVDRRIHSLVLAKKGVALMKVILPDHFQRIKKFTEILTKEESRTLVAIICKLLKGIKSFNED